MMSARQAFLLELNIGTWNSRRERFSFNLKSLEGTSQDGMQMEDSRNITMDTFVCVNVMQQMKVFFVKVLACIPTD